MAILRVIGLIVGGILVVLLVLVSSLVIAGYNDLHAQAANPIPTLRVLPDSSLLARGRHLAQVNCVGCHGQGNELPLRGGTEDFFKGPGMPPLGSLHAPNLTPGGRLADYTDAQLSRAIREGVNEKGHKLLVMPAAQYRGMSDRDLAAVITYLRSQPAVSGVVPKREVTLVAYLILGLHLVESSQQLPVTLPVADVPEGMTKEYGAYLVPVLGCRDCHGPDLRGGRPGQFPPKGPDLVSLASTHDLGKFTTALRQGVSARDGHALDPKVMPYAIYSHLTDTEAGAVYAYVQSLK